MPEDKQVVIFREAITAAKEDTGLGFARAASEITPKLPLEERHVVFSELLTIIRAESTFWRERALAILIPHFARRRGVSGRD